MTPLSGTYHGTSRPHVKLLHHPWKVDPGHGVTCHTLSCGMSPSGTSQTGCVRYYYCAMHCLSHELQLSTENRLFSIDHKRPPASCMSYLWHAPRGACIIHPTLLACPKQPRPTEHLDDATYVPDEIAVINHYGSCLWCKGIFQSRFSCSPSVPARSLHVSLNYHNHEAHQECDILHQIQPTFFPLPY